uniref:LYR motif containing 4 n=1 Tax=Cyprinus carpio carpio TaxID=630221 RepID=A0A9J8DEQ5_CYPCA
MLCLVDDLKARWLKILKISISCCLGGMMTYALRRVRDAFRENRTVEDPKVVEELVKRARDGLALIQRQVCIGKMFEIQKTVVEQEGKKSD